MTTQQAAAEPPSDLERRTRAAVSAATNRATRAALRAVLDLHQPYQPPEGHAWVSGGRKPHCNACDGGGDPFLAQDWPCATYDVITAALGVTSASQEAS
jgi:hypothetical protein